MYNFDEIVDRKGTDSSKWDQHKKKGYPQDAMPMWVADMDFKTLPEITQRLHEITDRGIYGYTVVPERYYDAIIDWMKQRHDLHLQKEWITAAPGVVSALKIAIRAYSHKGDAIIMQKPVYYPFDASVTLNDRVVVENVMKYKNGRYEIDFDDFEQKIIDHHVKLYILCNPHNPVGKVFTKEELYRLGMICKKHGVKVIADEIHMDFVFHGHCHIPFYNVDESFKEFSIICTAPSKTFNLAGLQTSNIIIANEEMKKQFEDFKLAAGFIGYNLMGMEACYSGYRYGHQWVDELVDYIKGNIDFMSDFIRRNIPELQVVEPEGLYLVWVDCRGLGMDEKQLERFMIDQCHLWLDEGYIFGSGGAGFERFNVACCRTYLEKALNQLEEAVRKLRTKF